MGVHLYVQGRVVPLQSLALVTLALAGIITASAVFSQQSIVLKCRASLQGEAQRKPERVALGSWRERYTINQRTRGVAKNNISHHFSAEPSEPHLSFHDNHDTRMAADYRAQSRWKSATWAGLADPASPNDLFIGEKERWL